MLRVSTSVHFFIYRIAALKLWKQRTAFGTYHDLLKVCCAGGDSRTATIICDIVINKVEEHGKWLASLHTVLW